jgi:hypothetical protein
MFYLRTFVFNCSIITLWSLSPPATNFQSQASLFPLRTSWSQLFTLTETCSILNLLRMYVLSDGAGVGAESSYDKSGGSVYECRHAVLITDVQNASHERPDTISNTERTWNAATLLWDILYQERCTTKAYSRTGQPLRVHMPKFSINFEEILSCSHGNFEKQDKVLESSTIIIDYCTTTIINS